MANTPKEDKAKKNIYQRMLAVMADVPYIKTEWKEGLKFFAVTHDAVTTKVRAALVKHGVYFQTTTLESVTNIVERKSRAGTREVSFTEIKLQCAWVNIDDPTDRIESIYHANGEASDAKSPGIAYSFAVKTAMLKGLSIATGQDEEVVAHEEAHEQAHEQAPSRPHRPAERYVVDEDIKDLGDEDSRNRELARGFFKKTAANSGVLLADVLRWVEEDADAAVAEMTKPQLKAACIRAKAAFPQSIVTKREEISF